MNWLPEWAEAVAAAAMDGRVGVTACGEYCAAGNDLNGHKKTVSESETVAGQQSEEITEMPKAKLGKPMEAKTLRPTRGSLLSRIPRFVNRFFG